MYLLENAVSGRLPRHDGTWGCTVTYKHKKEGKRVETILMDLKGDITVSACKTPQNTASIGTSRGITISLENYESARADVWVTLPSEPDDASINQTYERARRICDTKMEDAVSEIIQFKEQKKNGKD